MTRKFNSLDKYAISSIVVGGYALVLTIIGSLWSIFDEQYISLRDQIELFFSLAIPIFFLVAGIGVLKRKNWGRYIQILICSLALVDLIKETFKENYSQIGLTPILFNLAFGILFLGIIKFLTSKKVKSQFQDNEKYLLENNNKLSLDNEKPYTHAKNRLKRISTIAIVLGIILFLSTILGNKDLISNLGNNYDGVYSLFIKFIKIKYSFNFLMSFSLVISGFGLFKKKKWAWRLQIFLCYAFMLSIIITPVAIIWMMGEMGNGMPMAYLIIGFSSIVYLVILIIILKFLKSEKTKEAICTS